MGSQPKYEIGQNLVVVDEKSSYVGMSGVVDRVDPGLDESGMRWMYLLVFNKPKRKVNRKLFFEYKLSPPGESCDDKQREDSLMELLNI